MTYQSRRWIAHANQHRHFIVITSTAQSQHTSTAHVISVHSHSTLTWFSDDKKHARRGGDERYIRTAPKQAPNSNSPNQCCYRTLCDGSRLSERSWSTGLIARETAKCIVRSAQNRAAAGTGRWVLPLCPFTDPACQEPLM